MPTYAVQLELTQQGIENIKEGPSRVEAGRELVESMGGELHDIYLTMGSSDYIAIVEAPDDKTAAKVALSLGQEGSIRTQTSRAFTMEEYREIVDGLP